MNIQQIFDWHNIYYITSGKNVQFGNFNTKCPWCGYDDPSEHLGISLTTGYWACWRNQEHRGKKPHKLLMKLLNCSYEQVELLVSEIDRTQIQQKPLPEKNNTASIRSLTFPREIKPLSSISPKRFNAYLTNRGFNPAQKVMDQYQLRYCNLAGPWKDRIVIPVFIDKHLITWTARSIHSNAEIRYRTLAKEKSVYSLKETLWNYDQLKAALIEHLFLVEGPFDALKLDFYGQALGLRATCIFGLSIKDEQVDLLSSLTFRTLNILLDDGTTQQALQLAKRLRFLRPRIATLPPGAVDPGSLSIAQINYLLTNLINV